MTKLASTTVGVGGVASVIFSTIPQGYTDLKVVMSAKTSDANTGTIANIKFNSNTSSYSSRFLQGRGDSNSSSTGSTSAGDVGRIPGVNSPVTDNIYSNTEISILNYSSNNFKAYSSDAISEANQTIAYATMTAGLWSNTEPITSITFTPSAGSFAQYSTFTLYGIKNAAKTAGNSIKATGGNVIFDGTYVYHVFPSTGAFVPTQSLTADVLVVAGGGAGGTDGIRGGGGGAGGVIGFTNQTFSPTAYVCTVGAGGAGGTYNTVANSAGSNSLLGSLTAAIGGGRGGGDTVTGTKVGGNGGSGGGGGTTNSAGTGAVGGSSTQTSTGGVSYGNAGGSAGNQGAAGGGGGGAGSAGSNGANTYGVAGAGGVGTTTYSSWGAATGAGQNVSGTYYFAGGGGGGGTSSNRGTGGYGGGGQGGDNTSAEVAGTANTGGGGGGGGSTGNGVAGGSGIIIVRYKG
jgi:hypothetical protein